jgi:PhzF family phenazine biosynthesis protein
MTRTIRLFQVDAFTTEPLCGNPAGVVLDADELTGEQMQAIARELNTSDTAFVLRPDAPDHDLRMRFFTPRKESGFVGHATVATHTVLAAIGRPAAPRQKQHSGIVQVQLAEGSPPLVRIAQPPAPLRAAPPAELMQAILAALGLDAQALDPQCPVMIAGTTSTRLLLGLRESAQLARVEPDLGRLGELSAPAGAAGYFLYTRHSEIAGCDTEARMFCPALGISEDPVSGNAHGMLGVYLVSQRLLKASSGRAQFTGAQGHHLQRPGRVQVEVLVDSAAPTGVIIAGQAVIVFETSLRMAGSSAA